LVGSILVGLLDSISKSLFPELALFSLFLPMALILIFMPKGLFGK
jgi:branched-chain amino acid transport system permease protein